MVIYMSFESSDSRQQYILCHSVVAKQHKVYGLIKLTCICLKMIELSFQKHYSVR